MEDRTRTTEQRELIEEFGLLYESMGGTRMAGRMSGYLLFSDPPVQSLTQIAEALGVSKAAVSGAARLLLQLGVVELVSEAGRRGDFYRALPIQLDSVLGVDHVRRLHGLLERALGTVADRDQTHSNYALMRELLAFSAFLEAEIPELHARWLSRQDETTAADHGRATHDETPDTPGGRE